MSTPDNSFLPTRYHVEVYLRSFDGDPVFHAKSKNPIPVPAIGQHVEGRTFEDASVPLKRLRVVDIEHIFWVIKDSHLSHKLMIAVEAADQEN